MRSLALVLIVGALLLTVVGCGSEGSPDALGESQRRGSTDAQGIQTTPGGSRVVRDDGQK